MHVPIRLTLHMHVPLRPIHRLPRILIGNWPHFAIAHFLVSRLA